MMPASPRRNQSFVPMYGIRGGPLVIHPCAKYVRHDSDTRIRRIKQHAASTTGAEIQKQATPPAGLESDAVDTSDAVMMADMKISLAAKQLAEQVKESRKFWGDFRENFRNEVMSIKPYVDGHVLGQIWQRKVEHNNKPSEGKRQHDEKLSVQNVKLETCLNQIDEAIKFFIVAKLSNGQSTGHDPQHHHLGKIRTAGSLVVGLSKKSMLDEAASKDLLTELTDLERLLDPKSLHGFILDGAHETAETNHEHPGEGDSSRSKDDEAQEPITVDPVGDADEASGVDYYGHRE
ncbi:hypothetical protein F4810DRAFT_596030 [Camillea tinctor]|nr:hypothetical protein F4810DRAFT_596030 [Camillea tinctor]